MAFQIDPHAGISLAGAALHYGGLSRLDRNRHHLRRMKIDSQRRGWPCGQPLTEEEIDAYAQIEVECRDVTIGKFISGELRTRGIVRLPASSVSEGLTDIHPDQYRVLVLDWEKSSASSQAGLVIEGIVVFPPAAVQPDSADDRKKYAKASTYIREHWHDDLKGLGHNEVLRRVAAAVRCSTGTVKNVLKDERGHGGLLLGHQWPT